MPLCPPGWLINQSNPNGHLGLLMTAWAQKRVHPIKLVMIYFTLYSRSYCHLCDDMRIALEKLLGDVPYQLTLLDVDQDPDLLDLYDELVPVLFARKSSNPGVVEKLCHYFLDSKKVKEFCNE